MLNILLWAPTFQLPTTFTRRNAIASITGSIIFAPTAGETTPTNATTLIDVHTLIDVPTQTDIASDDRLSHWAFFGLAPPPIAGVLSYDDLVRFAKTGTIQTVQPAVQHDVLIATTHNGWRYASIIKDTDTTQFIMDCITDEKVIPFIFMPRDPLKNFIHNAAMVTLDTLLLVVIADQWNATNVKLTSFSTLKDFGNITDSSNHMDEE